jgi:hypothetical protein
MTATRDEHRALTSWSGNISDRLVRLAVGCCFVIRHAGYMGLWNGLALPAGVRTRHKLEAEAFAVSMLLNNAVLRRTRNGATAATSSIAGLSADTIE